MAQTLLHKIIETGSKKTFTHIFRIPKNYTLEEIIIHSIATSQEIHIPVKDQILLIGDLYVEEYPQETKYLVGVYTIGISKNKEYYELSIVVYPYSAKRYEILKISLADEENSIKDCTNLGYYLLLDKATIISVERTEIIRRSSDENSISIFNYKGKKDTPTTSKLDEIKKIYYAPWTYQSKNISVVNKITFGDIFLVNNLYKRYNDNEKYLILFQLCDYEDLSVNVYNILNSNKLHNIIRVKKVFHKIPPKMEETLENINKKFNEFPVVNTCLENQTDDICQEVEIGVIRDSIKGFCETIREKSNKALLICSFNTT